MKPYGNDWGAAEMFHKIFFVINPASGKPEPILNTINRLLKGTDIQWDVGVLIRDNLGEVMDRAEAFGAEVVAAYGGDGTLAAVAGQVVDRKLPMAILPGGTANVMSLELDIPGDLEGACRLLLGEEPRLRAIDVGRVNGCCFLSKVTVGFGSRIIEETSQENKNRFGTMAYIAQGIKNLLHRERIQLVIEIDGHRVETEAFSCMVTNSGNLGLRELALGPVDISDGLLDVFVIHDLGIKSLTALVTDVVKEVRREPLMHWRGKQIRLRTEPPEAIEYDGEMLEADVYEVEVLERAVQVLVGPEQEETPD